MRRQLRNLHQKYNKNLKKRLTKRTVFSRINNASRKDVILYRKYLEKYSSGRRGAPAKGIGRVDRREGSNPSFSALYFLNKMKKVVDKQ